ncbi:MAG: 23S rRNA (pseudouridine(1915)-N(3))-methyltransferase RlmH [Clostridia bacterium]|nr:23S rRNA (pseudouridine(1915)-N(3))-methyltransferase RlmH [Clostridia bacterium]
MIKIKIACVGGIKEKFFTDAIDEYKKRLGRFCTLSVVEVEEESRQQNIQKKIDIESERLLSVSSGSLVLLDRTGQMVSSEDLAQYLKQSQTGGVSEVTFIIGGSNGVNEKLKKACGRVISFGKITFPHQLFRVVLLEQIYRAFTINAGMPYHK